MNLIDWITQFFSPDVPVAVMIVALAILWTVVYDFFHILYSSVTCWFFKTTRM